MNFSGGGGVTELFEQNGMQFARDGLMILTTNFGTGGNASGGGRLMSSSVNGAYQIPVGKKFVVYLIFGILTTAEVATPSAGYCDNDLGWNSTAVATNPVYIGGNGNRVGFYAGGTNPYLKIPTGFEIPAGKYAFYIGTGTGAGLIHFVGKLVDA